MSDYYKKDFLEELDDYLKKKMEIVNAKNGFYTSYFYRNDDAVNDHEFKELMDIAYEYVSNLYNIPKEELKSVDIYFEKLPNDIAGVYKPMDESILINRDILNDRDYKQLLKTLVHELTHYIQHKKKISIWNYKSFSEYIASYHIDPNEIMARNTERLFVDHLSRLGYL